MRISWKIFELHLKHTFTIARGSSDVRRTVIIELEHHGIIGYGEAAPLVRYGETIETVIGFFMKLELHRFPDPIKMEDILRYVDGVDSGNTAAKAAIDIALHDWQGKKNGKSLWALWGLDRSNIPRTSFTIGIDSVAVLEQKIKEAEQYPILKVKVGVPNDEEIITAIRRLTDKPIRVDANEGWVIKEQALEKILWLEKQNIEFVEQPMPADQLDDLAWLKERVHIPLMADESVKTLSDIPNIRHCFDGINIKLMKSAGIEEAKRMIRKAREVNMKVMLGCMIESSVGIAAAAHLSPLVDYTDLDGNVLISNDPYEGLNLVDGKIFPSTKTGLGVTPRDHVNQST